jgi:hypothetical protein
MKAADEIDRLLEFLDASDLDPDLEPTLGFMNGPSEMDECELPVDDEPSLGSSNDYHGNGASYQNCTSNVVDGEGPEEDLEPSLGSLGGLVWGGNSDEREEDPADGREEVNEDGDGRPDDEPSLGWTDEEAARGRTCAGCYGNDADREQGEPTRPPQNRTVIDREPITVEVSYRRFLRGLTLEQRKRVKAARQRGVGSDVIIA